MVDDDELIQDSLEAMLTARGHRVEIAASGEVALASVASGSRPDVVILDMNMPGMGGAGTLPRLRDLLPHVPLVLATGRADQTALDLVHRHSLVSLLPKPFGATELEAHLRGLNRLMLPQ